MASGMASRTRSSSKAAQKAHQPVPPSFFTDLPPPLHRLVASYLETHEIIRVGGMSPWLHDIYPAEATGYLYIYHVPFTHGNCPPQVDPQWVTWVKHHAASLTRLLARMPRLTAVSQGLHALFDEEVLGYALCALPSPTRLIEIESYGVPYTPEDELRTAAPSFLAVAMHKGQLPLLQSLSMAGSDWEFMGRGANLGLVSSAVTLGRLPHLVNLTLMRGPCLDQMTHAFRGRPQLDQFCPTPAPSQAMVKTLKLDYPSTGVLREAGSLFDLLSLPMFGSLEELDLNVELLYDNMDVRGHGNVLVDYLYFKKPGGCPLFGA